MPILAHNGRQWWTIADLGFQWWWVVDGGGSSMDGNLLLEAFASMDSANYSESLYFIPAASSYYLPPMDCCWAPALMDTLSPPMRSHLRSSFHTVQQLITSRNDLHKRWYDNLKQQQYGHVHDIIWYLYNIYRLYIIAFFCVYTSCISTSIHLSCRCICQIKQLQEKPNPSVQGCKDPIPRTVTICISRCLATHNTYIDQPLLLRLIR